MYNESMEKKFAQAVAATGMAIALTVGGAQVANAGGEPVAPTEVQSGNVVHLEVPLYWQGKNECGPESIKMATDSLGLNYKKEQIILTASNVGLGSFDATAGINPIVMAPEAVMATATKLGVRVEGGEDKNIGDIFNWLNRGMPVIVDIVYNPYDKINPSFGHFIVVTGIDLDKGKVYANSSLAANYELEYDLAVFEKLWAGPVDVGGPVTKNGYSHWAIALAGPDGQIAQNYQQHVDAVGYAPPKAASEPSKKNGYMAPAVAPKESPSSPYRQD